MVWQWGPQLAALSKVRRVVAPTLLGFGQSGPPGAGRVLERQAAAVVECVAGDFDLCGLSYGGFVALEIARRWPSRVGKVVLSDCPGPCFTPDDVVELCDRFGVGSVPDLLLPTDVRGVRTLVQLAYHRPPWIPDFVLADVLRTTYRHRRTEQLPILEDLVARTHDPPSLEADHETLVIWGEHDRFFPLPRGREFAGRLPRARFEVLRDTAHAPNLQASGRFSRLVVDFLS
jgi:pimeloyl-ACP methyl ester carboxylesterase